MSYSISVHKEDGNIEQFVAPAGVTLLAASEQSMKKGIAVGCRGGGCGHCRVHILHGTYTAKVMSKAHIGEAERLANIVLACRVIPTSDLEVRADKPTINKAAPSSAV